MFPQPVFAVRIVVETCSRKSLDKCGRWVDGWVGRVAFLVSQAPAHFYRAARCGNERSLRFLKRLPPAPLVSPRSLRGPTSATSNRPWGITKCPPCAFEVLRAPPLFRFPVRGEKGSGTHGRAAEHITDRIEIGVRLNLGRAWQAALHFLVVAPLLLPPRPQK